jgi:hypothetical protein
METFTDFQGSVFMRRQMEEMLRTIDLRHPLRAGGEFHADKIVSADQRAVADVSGQPQFSHSHSQFRVYRNHRFCLYARAGGRDILQDSVDTVRPARPVTPKELDYIGA